MRQDYADHVVNNFVHFAGYPGRLVIAGLDETGKYFVQACAMTARSDPNRNRLYAEPMHGLVRTEVANPSKPAGNPELTLYDAMIECGPHFVVGNGRQTAVLMEWMEGRGDSLWKFGYEDDPPVFTSRITAVSVLRPNPQIILCAIRKSPHNEEAIEHSRNYLLHDMEPGIGWFLTTYKCDGDPPSPSEGMPYELPLKSSMEPLTDELWDALNQENRVALAVKFIELKSGISSLTLRNKYFGD